MKISIKQLRKVIREVLEETSKKAPVNEKKDDLDEMDVLEADCADDIDED